MRTLFLSPIILVHLVKPFVIIDCNDKEEKPAPETHVCVGTFRPPFEEAWKLVQYADRYQCPVCGDPLMSQWRETARSHRHDCWMAGHFDTPVYKRIDSGTR